MYDVNISVFLSQKENKSFFHEKLKKFYLENLQQVYCRANQKWQWCNTLFTIAK